MMPPEDAPTFYHCDDDGDTLEAYGYPPTGRSDSPMMVFRIATDPDMEEVYEHPASERDVLLRLDDVEALVSRLTRWLVEVTPRDSDS